MMTDDEFFAEYGVTYSKAKDKIKENQLKYNQWLDDINKKQETYLANQTRRQKLEWLVELAKRKRIIANWQNEL